MTADVLRQTGIDYVARARALQPMLDELSPRIERERRLPPELVSALHDAGLFRMILPRSQNGGEIDPITLFHVTEAIAKSDASTAWCLGQAAGCCTTAAYLDHDVAWKIFGSDPHAVLAWGPGPKVKAVACEGGYRITGTWSFASGCRHATWLGAHCPIFEADGTPRKDAYGGREERTFLVPASEVQWTDIWQVMGLRGTASDAFSLDNHFVRADHSITRDFRNLHECREPGPLYRMSAMVLYAIAFSGVAAGIARGALDHFVDLSRNKVPRGLKSPIRDNAVVQTGAAEAEARLSSARVWLLHVVREVWDQVRQPGGALTLEHRMSLRLATTWTIHQSRNAVDYAYNAAGATAIFESNPLERRFRDIHTLTQQLQGRLAHLEAVGAWLLGSEPDLTFV
jgi:alkylation response protein AidB-like acyl-CoA dehydrogenase